MLEDRLLILKPCGWETTGHADAPQLPDFLQAARRGSGAARRGSEAVESEGNGDFQDPVPDEGMNSVELVSLEMVAHSFFDSSCSLRRREGGLSDGFHVDVAGVENIARRPLWSKVPCVLKSAPWALHVSPGECGALCPACGAK